MELIPKGYADAGSISLYYATRTLLLAKTHAFVEYIIAAFKQNKFASGSQGV